MIEKITMPAHGGMMQFSLNGPEKLQLSTVPQQFWMTGPPQGDLTIGLFPNRIGLAVKRGDMSIGAIVGRYKGK
jgi:hypothetical protein